MLSSVAERIRLINFRLQRVKERSISEYQTQGILISRDLKNNGSHGNYPCY
jgi:hypothetical protein